jgi:hypothetical protein
VLALVLAGSAPEAQAHDADVVYVLVRSRSGAATELVETVTLTASTLGQLAPVDADEDGLLGQADLDERAASLKAGLWDDMPLTAGGGLCSRSNERAWLREGFVELEAVFGCGAGELRQDFRFLRVLPTNYRVVLGSQFDGERNRSFAQGTHSSVTVPRPPKPGWWSTVAFSSGLTVGLTRALDGVAWASLLALAFSLSRWREGWGAAGAVVVGLGVGSVLSLPPWVGALCAALGAVALAASARSLPRGAGAFFGLCLGTFTGGGGVAGGVGFVLGASLVAVPVLVGGVAVGRLLRRRGSTLRLARWLAAGFAVIAAAQVF